MIQRHRPRSRAAAQTLMTLACTLLVLATLPASGGEAQVELGLQKLADATSGWAEVSMNKATDTARFVRIPSGVSKAMVDGTTPREKAASFLEQHGGAFGIKDAARELVLFEVANKGVFTSASYQQVYGDVPVFGGVLRVHFDRAGDLVAANGSFVPDLKLNTTPKWSAEAAARVAIRHVGGADKGFGKALNIQDDLFAADSRLFVFRSGLVQGVPGRNHLVFEVEVVNKVRSVREFVYVDAHFGKVVDQFTGIHDAKFRRAYDAEGLPHPGPNYPGSPFWVEGDPFPTFNVEADNMIYASGETYDLYFNAFGRDSFDDGGATMDAIFNRGDSCPNASWNGVYISFCPGLTTDDITGHEWGHAYTEYTNNLIYAWQSGALNESYSDIFGETVDLINGRGLDSPGGSRSDGGCSTFNGGAPDVSYRWLMGEESSLGAIRDMWNPNCENDPGKVSDSGQYDCNFEPDVGGVHTNSGIPNHAFALMVDGGTYNGVTVTALGLTKAVHIEWQAAILLGPTSDFVENADALDAACLALTGLNLPDLLTGGAPFEVITAGDCAEVADAISAVEMRDEPTFCGFTPLLDPNAPALCGGGTVDDIHFQDWEGGLGAWNVGTRAVVNPGTFDTPDWAVVGNLPNNQPGSAAFVEDGPRGDCDTDVEAGILYLQSPVINIPAGASPQLAFDHWVATEAGWDGANVKASVNGGSYSVIASAAFDFNAYNGTLTSFDPQFGNSDNPMAGESAFTGTDGGSVGGSWGQSQVDLSGLAGPGDNVQLRFEMGLDGCNGVIGWYVDDTRVYTCEVDPCGDGFCAGSGAGENCTTCPADCPSFPISGADPNNNVCEAGDGETCYNTNDCNGTTSGKPSNRFCCGLDANESTPYSPNGCDSRCDTGGNSCTTVPVGGGGSTCCGDGTCEDPQETTANCPIDCPAPSCGDGQVDPPEVCDGGNLGGETCESQGCDPGPGLACDGDCLGFDTSGCTGCGGGCTLAQEGESCRDDVDCCSNNCSGGKPANRVCLAP